MGRPIVEAMVGLGILATILLPATALQLRQMRQLERLLLHGNLDSELEEWARSLHLLEENLLVIERDSQRSTVSRGSTVEWQDSVGERKTFFTLRWIPGSECDLIRMTARQDRVRRVLWVPLMLKG